MHNCFSYAGFFSSDSHPIEVGYVVYLKNKITPTLPILMVLLSNELLCLGAHAQARYTVVYLCVCVCVCLCRLLYSCSKINQVQVRVLWTSRSSYVYLDFNSSICKIMLHSRVMPTWNSIAAFSEECVAKLVHGVLLLYLVVMP